MAVLYIKKSKTKREIGKNVAGSGNAPTRVCTNCGEEARAFEVYPNYSTFKCAKCSTTFTYMQDKKEDTAKVKKMGAIVLRDRSNEKKKEEQIIASSNCSIQEKIKFIKESMQSKKLVSFRYVDNKGNSAKRTVEPYKLMIRDSSIILFAYCTDNKGIRSFKLDKIDAIEVLPYIFEQRYPIEDQTNETEKDG